MANSTRPKIGFSIAAITVAIAAATVANAQPTRSAESRDKAAIAGMDRAACASEACRELIVEIASDRLRRGVAGVKEVTILEQRISEIDAQLGDGPTLSGPSIAEEAAEAEALADAALDAAQRAAEEPPK